MSARRRPIAATTTELEAGKAVYARACAACHGATGQGASGPGLTNYSDLVGAARMIRQGGVEMPAMASLLKPEEIDQVAKYVANGLRTTSAGPDPSQSRSEP